MLRMPVPGTASQRKFVLRPMARSFESEYPHANPLAVKAAFVPRLKSALLALMTSLGN